MKSIRTISNLVLISLVALLAGCIGDGPEVYDEYGQLQKDIQTIDDHLTANGITTHKDLRGIRIHIDELGTGLPALETNKVKIAYTGRILGSTTAFESGTVTGQMLRNYIQGWRMAMTILPVGTKATIYIPSPLAYKNQASGPIPANSILEFDIDFKEIEYSETEKQKLGLDTLAIDHYIESKQIMNVMTDTTGLRYVVTTAGLGPKPSWYSTLKLKLVYKLLSDDTKTIATVDLEPSSTYQSRVVDQINGLKVGLQKLPIGAKATFYIPSGLAFGITAVNDANGAVLVPPNSNIIVEAELVDIVTP